MQKKSKAKLRVTQCKYDKILDKCNRNLDKDMISAIFICMSYLRDCRLYARRMAQTDRLYKVPYFVEVVLRNPLNIDRFSTII